MRIVYLDTDNDKNKLPFGNQIEWNSGHRQPGTLFDFKFILMACVRVDMK